MEPSIADQLRATWPLLPDAGPVTKAQRELIHRAADLLDEQEDRINELQSAQ